MHERRKYKAIVFDLDGTLIDSAPDIHAAINRTLAEAGRRPLPLESVKQFIGDGAERLVARAFAATGPALDGGALARHYERFLERYEGSEAVALTRPYPGVVETLGRLAASGYRLGLCTNKPAGPTAEVLARLGLASYFAAALSPEQVPALKPDPRHLLAVLAALAAAPGEAVMVGDNANDVAVARGAGVPVVAVRYGYPRMAPEALGADLLIERMAELPEALRRLETVAARG